MKRDERDEDAGDIHYIHGFYTGRGNAFGENEGGVDISKITDARNQKPIFSGGRRSGMYSCSKVSSFQALET